VNSTHYDPSDPALQADPYPFYRRLRAEDPVHRNPPGFWFVTRYDDVRSLLRDPRMGADNGANAPQRGGDHLERMAGGDTPSLILMDPPDHSRVRALVNKAFTPRNVQRLRARIERITARLLDDWTDDEVDFLQFAYQLPFEVICALLDVPADRWAQLREWSEDMAYSVEPVVTDETLSRARRGRRNIVAYLRELVELRRAAPGEDILSQLILAEAAS
jgi:cytochrome P450